MHIRKTTRNWAIAGGVAAMLAASTAGVRAQDATAPAPATAAPAPATAAPAPATAAPAPATPDPSATPATPDTTAAPAPATTPGAMDNSASTSGNMSSGAMSGSMMPSGTLDYSILNNPTYDYIDLQQAKARGLSDSQIATVAKISQETGKPFRAVSAAVERGETFPVLAAENNLKIGDVYDIDKQKQEISDYYAAYDSATSKIGSGASMMNGSMASGSDMSGGSMAATSSSSSMSAMMAPLDIVDTAMAAKNLTTLVKALQVAGLVETLKGAGPFTVFAPDDKAFSKLPAGQLDALLADPAKLKTILTYHVIPASIMAADAGAMTSPTSPPTVQGGTLQVTKDSRGRLKINDATVIKGDIKASNGVIHIINKVLMPPMDSAAPAAGATGTDTTTPPATGTAAPATPGADNTTPPAAGTPPATPAPAQ